MYANNALLAYLLYWYTYGRSLKEKDIRLVFLRVLLVCFVRSSTHIACQIVSVSARGHKQLMMLLSVGKEGLREEG